MDKKKKTNRYSLNFEKAHDKIIEWCEYQSNFSDAIKYLIEEDMKKNGIRNLQEFIPSVRHVPNNIRKITNSDIELDLENSEVVFKEIETHKEVLSAPTVASIDHKEEKPVKEEPKPLQVAEPKKRGRPPKNKEPKVNVDCFND